MKMLFAGTAFFAALAAPLAAEIKHDRKLEQAMMDIVAARIGQIRGGFAYDRKPEMVALRDEVTTGSIAIETTNLRFSQEFAPGLRR